VAITDGSNKQDWGLWIAYGLFISTGGFTSDAKTTARSSHVHVELIDFDRFIALWQEFYQKFNDEDKDRLRLRPVYFYEPAI
jgi:restriction system protein